MNFYIFHIGNIKRIFMSQTTQQNIYCTVYIDIWINILQNIGTIKLCNFEQDKCHIKVSGDNIKQ